MVFELPRDLVFYENNCPDPRFSIAKRIAQRLDFLSRKELPGEFEGDFNRTGTEFVSTVCALVISVGRTTAPRRRSSKGQWTAEEDELLRRAVQCFKGKSWKKIAEFILNRAAVQYLHRWRKVLNPEIIKGPWSREEDEMIIELVSKYGPKK